MTELQQLHVLDTEDARTATPIDRPGQLPSEVQGTLYADADAEELVPLDIVLGRDGDRFVASLLEELDLDERFQPAELRRVDRIDPTESDDVDLGELLVAPDGTLLFVGRDPTTRDTQTSPIYGFVIDPTAPIPAPRSAQEALDLLKPVDVQKAIASDGPRPARQGEWWLLPTRAVPVGSTFRPGVNARPFGPSPLGNHVPREYGFGVGDDTLVERVRERAPVPDSVRTVPETIRWVHDQPDYRDTLDWGGASRPRRRGLHPRDPPTPPERTLRRDRRRPVARGPHPRRRGLDRRRRDGSGSTRLT